MPFDIEDEDESPQDQQYQSHEETLEYQGYGDYEEEDGSGIPDDSSNSVLLRKGRKFSDNDFAPVQKKNPLGSHFGTRIGDTRQPGGLFMSKTPSGRPPRQRTRLSDDPEWFGEDEEYKPLPMAQKGTDSKPSIAGTVAATGDEDGAKKVDPIDVLFLLSLTLFVGMFGVLFFINPTGYLRLAPIYVLFLSFSYMFCYLLYRADISIRTKLFRQYVEIDRGRLYRGAFVFSLLFFIAALVYPHMQMKKALEEFEHCQSNCKLIHLKIEAFAAKNRGSMYPLELSQLSPDYIDHMPTCPAAKKDSYSKSYQVNKERTVYTFYCDGENHRKVVTKPGNYPLYSSIRQEIILRPAPGEE